MKYTIRVPLDQFAYLETEIEGTAEDALREYKHAKTQFLANGVGLAGLVPKDWNAWLDRYLTDGKGNQEMYAKMNEKQVFAVQEIKKAMARLKANKTDYGESEID